MTIDELIILKTYLPTHLIDYSGIMPGPANPAMQGGGTKEWAAHCQIYKNDFRLQLCFYAKSL